MPQLCGLCVETNDVVGDGDLTLGDSPRQNQVDVGNLPAYICITLEKESPRKICGGTPSLN